MTNELLNSKKPRGRPITRQPLNEITISTFHIYAQLNKVYVDYPISKYIFVIYISDQTYVSNIDNQTPERGIPIITCGRPPEKDIKKRKVLHSK